MKRFAATRLFTVFLAFTLFAGVQAKATGAGSCPMHQAAAHGHNHAHQHHDGHAHGKTVACNCLDACQAAGPPAFIAAQGFLRVTEVSAVSRVAVPHVEVRGAIAVRAHLLPFPNAPPVLS